MSDVAREEISVGGEVWIWGFSIEFVSVFMHFQAILTGTDSSVGSEPESPLSISMLIIMMHVFIF